VYVYWRSMLARRQVNYSHRTARFGTRISSPRTSTGTDSDRRRPTFFTIRGPSVSPQNPPMVPSRRTHRWQGTTGATGLSVALARLTARRGAVQCPPWPACVCHHTGPASSRLHEPRESTRSRERHLSRTLAGCTGDLGVPASGRLKGHGILWQ
jgi:hypothetical protein